MRVVDIKHPKHVNAPARYKLRLTLGAALNGEYIGPMLLILPPTGDNAGNGRVIQLERGENITAEIKRSILEIIAKGRTVVVTIPDFDDACDAFADLADGTGFPMQAAEVEAA